MIAIFLGLSLAMACAKKVVPPPPEPLPPKPAIVKFVFVNRFGFKNDSTKHGQNDTVFQASCFDIKYYNRKTNISTLASACYNRNYMATTYALTDSILINEFEVNPGCHYTFQIDLIWKRPMSPTTTKVLTYQNLKYPGKDTLKFERDTIIKFVWPNDSTSGRFVKTLQWP